MSTYNSADIAAFNGGVWVFCEQRQGTMMPTSFELISEGRKLADELGTKLYGILLGHNIEGIAKELGGYGADGVYVCDHPLLENYTTDGYTKVICDTIMEYKPEVMLIGATNIGRDLGPRCAARLHTGLCADCTHLDIDVPKYKQFLRDSSTLAPAMIDGIPEEDRNLKMTRPAFGGHLMATIICPRFRPAMATVRPGVMKKAEFDQAKADACELIKPTIALTENDMETQVVEVVKAAKKLVDLIALTWSSPWAVVSPRTSRVASSWLRSWLLSWAASLAAPVLPSTLAGCPPTIRSVRPARPFTPRSMLLWASPAPSSTRPVCRIPSASSR